MRIRERKCKVKQRAERVANAKYERDRKIFLW